MLWSKLFIPTLREDPAEAEVASHQLLLRAGYIRQLSAGIYSYLFLAQRSLLKIQQHRARRKWTPSARRRFLLPALNPAEVWQESGRWDVMGDNMFRLKDRFGRDLCLGMTHEEVMTVIARGELRSYKQLPQIWYQIQTKFRDEPRPKSGLLRVRQFIMKDSYTFDMDQAGLDAAYDKHYQAYCRIFDRCGLEYIGGGGALGRHGRQPVARVHGGVGSGRGLRGRVPGLRLRGQPGEGRCRCPPRRPPPIPKATSSPEEFHTPGRKTIAEVAEFTGLPETLADEEPGAGGRRQAGAGDAARRSSVERNQVRAPSSTIPSSAPRIPRRSASGSAPTPDRWGRWASATCPSSPTRRSRAAAT